MTLTDRLEAFFKAYPDTWIDGRELATIAGAYAWRSRCSDCRLQRRMQIENRVVYVRNASGKVVAKRSEYRYVTQPSLLADAS